MFWSGFAPHVSERLIAAGGFTLGSAKIDTAEEDREPVSFLWVEAGRLCWQRMPATSRMPGT
jgi:hypothetical protein